jgi:hypothetical protein
MTTTTPPGGQPRPAAPSPPDDPPFRDAEPVGDRHTGPRSFARLEVVSGGTALSLWGGPETAESDPVTQVQLQLRPECPVVIGRQEGTPPPYLDPAYCPTRVVPGTGQAVVWSDSEGKDVRVSRAHFMLRGAAGGIVLTTGVPRVGGGIRPPLNGTWLWDAAWRFMDPGEDYLIEHRTTAELLLPNGTVVRIRAE